jgi:recombinational DNA repair protein (RecF pathway)
MTMLRVLGHLPAFDVCAECGQPIAPAARTPFAMLDGGAMCSDCRVGKKQVVSVSTAVLKTMKLFAETEMGAWQFVEIDPKVYGELRGVLNKYISHLMGHAPKMHKLLAGLAKQ